MRRLAGSIVVALTLFASVTRADTPPSVWDRAKDPSLSESYRIHLEVERRLALADRSALAEPIALTVRALLERYHAAESKDPLLRFDLARVYAELRDYARAQKVLEPALVEFPDHPAAEEGWMNLAQACGHLGDNECERRAYGHVLRNETEELQRATPTLNLAESEMHFGNLREAVEGYREALRISGKMPGTTMAPLAVWGLAVALDRSGDHISAEREARFAQQLERSMGVPSLLHDSSKVFFTPDWEISYYDGLGAAAAAREATQPADIVRLWRAAEQAFGRYVRDGEPAKDRWVEIAKARLATVKAEREKAEKKYGKNPQRDVDEDERSL